jgi:hypothetical protein
MKNCVKNLVIIKVSRNIAFEFNFSTIFPELYCQDLCKISAQTLTNERKKQIFQFFILRYC